MKRSRIDEFSFVPWQQGRLLQTRRVARMDSLWKRESEERERRCAFVFFGVLDEGRGRILVHEFANAEDCAAAVAAHNAAVALWAPVDAMRVIEDAGAEIWHSLRKWRGDPTQRDDHPLTCGCTVCN